MTEIVVVLVLILLNGFFAMSEIAIVSSRKSKLEQAAANGSKGAATALKLLERPENFLSSVQIGITLVGIISGLYGGVAIVEDFTPIVAGIEFLKPNALEISYFLVVGIITYLSLVVGELLPKTIAFNDPEKIAINVAPVMSWLAVATLPVVKVLSLSTRLLQKLLMIKEKQEAPVSEDELKLLIEQGAKFGTFDRYESEMIKSVFRFGDRTARSVMTPKRVVVALNLDHDFNRNLKIILSHDFKIFPAYKGNIDNVVGIVETKEFLKKYSQGRQFKIEDLVYRPVLVPENLQSTRIIESFRSSKYHFGLVIDESGAFKGVITLHDIIENILGDLPEKDEAEDAPDITRREDGSNLVDGTMLLDILGEKLGIDFPDKESEFVTLGGFVAATLGKIPHAGDSFFHGSFRFEVVDMDGRRVDKVMISGPHDSALY